MKRWIVKLFIGSYLSLLSYGILCHTLSINLDHHPNMYYIVWDMFCGWSAYAYKLHIVGEGASGKFYKLAPGPWGEIVPYGSEGRLQYDALVQHSAKIAMNTLRHTDHEPITRIFVIEEHWAKKYDIPEYLWKQRYEEPKQRVSYFHVRQELTGDGIATRTAANWISHQAALAFADNPRLNLEVRSGQNFFMIDHSRNNGNGYFATETGTTFRPVSAPLGN